MRRQHFLLLPAILALGFGIIACDDDDGDGDRDLNADEVRGAISDALQQTRDGATDLADDIDDEVDDANLADVDDKVRDNWNVRCNQLSKDAEDEDVGAELTDVCGDLKEGLDNDDGDAVEVASDRLKEIADEIEGDAKNDDK